MSSLTEQDYNSFLNKFKSTTNNKNQQQIKNILLNKNEIINRIVKTNSRLETRSEWSNGKHIIKKVKSIIVNKQGHPNMSKENNKSVYKKEMTFSNELNSYDDYFLKAKATYIVKPVSPLKTSREGLNSYLNKEFLIRKKNKKWWENYKGPLNDNSMLEEMHLIDIFIPSDRSLLMKKDEEYVFSKGLEAKEVLNKIKECYLDRTYVNENKNEYFIQNLYKGLLFEYSKERGCLSN